MTRFVTTVQHSGRRRSSVAMAAAVLTAIGGAALWLLGSSIPDSSLQMEGTLFGDAGQEKKYGVGSLHTREAPARLSSKTLEVIAAPRTHFRTGTELPVLTVELYRGTLLIRGDVRLVLGEATANGNGDFVLTTEPGQAIEQVNASLETLTHGKPLDARAIASAAPQTLLVLTGHLDLRTAGQPPQSLVGGQTWPGPR